MALMLKRQRNGALRDDWYGVYTESDGKRKVINLNVKVDGTPPASMKVSDAGDREFEDSRDEAQKVLDSFVTEARRKGRADHLSERLIESKTGRVIEHVLIDQLAERWFGLKLGGNPAGPHAAGVRATFQRFIAYMAKKKPFAKFLYEVTPVDAIGFINEMAGPFAPRTVSGYRTLMRSSFRRFLPVGVANPFDDVSPRSNSSEMIHRIPFSETELIALLNHADEHFMRPLISAAACTGMRRSDVCKLKWKDIDLGSGIITVKTSKTGSSVEIPILGLLRTVLSERLNNGSEYVFPDAVSMLLNSPYGLTYRLKRIIARALSDNANSNPHEIRISPESIQAEGSNEIMSRIPAGKRRDRMLDTFNLYCSDKSIRDIEKEKGRSKGTISNDLHAVERLINKQFIKSTGGIGIKSDVDNLTRIDRESGKNAASVRDWHALRTTFATMALSAGIPMELVKRVTGHATVDVVLRHYFRPNRDVFKAAFNNALPDVLTGAKSPTPTLTDTDTAMTTEMDALLAKIKSGAANESDKARFRELAAQV